MLENFVPPYNATVMEKLDAENIVMLGKTTMDEFAMGGSTQTSAFYKTKRILMILTVYLAAHPADLLRLSLRDLLLLLLVLIQADLSDSLLLCNMWYQASIPSEFQDLVTMAFASSLDQIGSIGLDAP